LEQHAAGYGYGANGIWQANTPKRPFGPSPHGGNWGNTPWREAMKLPGAAQLGRASRLLEKEGVCPMHPCNALLTIEPSAVHSNKTVLCGGAFPRRIWIYLYGPVYPWEADAFYLNALPKHTLYRAVFLNPRTGKYEEQISRRTDRKGRFKLPLPPTFEDWILVLQQDETSRPPVFSGFITRFKKALVRR